MQHGPRLWHGPCVFLLLVIRFPISGAHRWRHPLSHVDLAAALAAEFEALHGPPDRPIATEADYACEINRRRERIAAVCLSGGGIRSASFALGVLQSLARHGLLRQFHYLSTVSGGGYIGSWFQAWRRQAGGLGAVIQGLNQRDPDTGAEPPELAGL